MPAFADLESSRTTVSFWAAQQRADVQRIDAEIKAAIDAIVAQRRELHQLLTTAIYGSGRPRRRKARTMEARP